jgi:uncharacterized protein (TIGR02246 family)
MRCHFLRALRAASFAALPVVLLALSTACGDESGTTGPLATREPEASPASLAAISTAPLLDIVSAQFAAWTAKDADAYAATYTPDARFLAPNGNVFEGRDGIRAAHAFLFAGPFAPTTETQTIADVRFLTGSIAVVYLNATLTGYAGPGPTEPGVLRTTKTWVVVKRAGTWQIMTQHMAPVAPSP